MEDQLIAHLDTLGPMEQLHFCARLQSIQAKYRSQANKALGAENYGKRYTNDEKELIKEYTAQGVSKYDIAILMKRTANGLSQQRQKILIDDDHNKTSISRLFPNEVSTDLLAPQHNSWA